MSPQRRSAMGRRRWIAVVLTQLLVVTAASAAKLYAIGNSLTYDMYADGVQRLASDAGFDLDVDFHIRSSSSLTYIAANPTDVTVMRPAMWNEALAGIAYDYITLEPYYGFDAPSYASELEAAVRIVETALAGASSGAVFYLYEAWPNRQDTGGDYHAYWTQTVAADPNQKPLQARQFYDRLLADLRTRFAERAVFQVIPVGDVLDRIDRDAHAGLIPGLADANALYRDALHMGEVGRFVAGATVLTTLRRQPLDRTNSMDMYQLNDGVAELTPELATILLATVWKVVAEDPRTGVAKDDSPESTEDQGGGSVEWPMLFALILLGMKRRLFKR